MMFHYTCSHGAEGIRRTGLVRSGASMGVKFAQAQFAWFTDLDAPNREALGLSSLILDCDRTTHRFQATGGLIVPWMTIRRALPRPFVNELESFDGAMPRHWFVAADAVPAVETS